MNALTAARADLLTVVAGDADSFASFNYVPEELPPACVVIDADDDYLDQAETHDPDDWWLTMRVHALVDLTSNQQAIEDLDRILTTVLPRLARSDWEVANVGRPNPLHTTEWLAHGVPITVRNLVTLTPGEPA